MYRKNLETIPIWVRLPNLNFYFWTNFALSKIASVIGNPICMDYATATGTRYAFDRICVEVDVDAEFPFELRMKYKDKLSFKKLSMLRSQTLVNHAKPSTMEINSIF